MPDSIITHVSVDAAPEQAFETFTARLGSWWPPDYTWSREVLEDIGMEPGEGGFCYERGPDGFRCDWGRVLAWDPPRRVVFTWQITARREPEPNPARASEVTVRFADDGGGGTRVELEHRAFERHGEEAAEYAAALASPEGWPLLLERFAAAAAPAQA
jgi:uncharacterized protein YndB with AHSA1/START domain